MNSTFMMDVALQFYAQKGLAIFPCAEKKPLVGTGFKAATTDVKQITAWWTEHPKAQIGVPTGAVNHLLAIDVDGPAGEVWIKKQNWPETFCVNTSPGHFQYWFRQPDGLTTRCSARVLAPEVDVRGDSGYCIGPYSFHHETHKPYCIVRNLPQAEAPACLLELVTGNRGPVNGNRFSPPVTGDEIPKGQRHKTLLSIAGALRARGLSGSMILAQLEVVNSRQCNPPLENSKLQELADYVGKKPSGFPGAKPMETSAEVDMEPYSEVAPEQLRWLWPTRVPRGKLTIFSGEPGQGKSMVTLDVAARISCGAAFPDGALSEIGDVVLLNAEDDPADTVRPRLDAAGADVRRVHRIKRVKVTLADGATGESTFSLSRDIEKLGEAFARFPAARLFVIDPISAYMGAVDSWKDSAVRGLLAPLADLAQRTGVTTIGVMHPKKGDGSAMQRIVSGSIAFQAAARAVWGFANDPESPGRHVMVAVKANLGPDSNGLGYRIQAVDDVARIVWDGDSVHLDADAALGRSAHREERSKFMETTEWLRQLLDDGPVLVTDIQREAKAAGNSWRSVERAKQNLGAIATRKSIPGPWYWSVRPPNRSNAEPAGQPESDDSEIPF